MDSLLRLPIMLSDVQSRFKHKNVSHTNLGLFIIGNNVQSVVCTIAEC